jgi:Leucine-rich repeat (LRR) protein
MTTLPESLFSANAVKYLKIRGWNLQSMPDLFDNLQTLEELELDLGNEFTDLPASVFRLKNLKKFKLKGYAITKLHDNMEGLESLEELEIEHLRVEKLPESFKKLKNLKHLHIEYASYDVFSAITTLTNLETLKLDRYHTPFLIEKPLTALTNLREVTMKFNQKITDDIYHLPRTIQKIRLQDDCWKDKESAISLGKFINHFNQAKEISIDQLNTADISEPILPNTALKTLSFSDTKMPQLPDSISNLINLDYFSIFRCSLDALNPALYDCKNLKYIRIVQAQFTTIPAGISKMENLVKLGFEVCKIESLPDDIMQMKALEKLCLDRTPLLDNKDFKTLIKRKIKGLKVIKSYYD